MQNFQSHIRYWLQSSKRNWETAQGLYKLGHRDACLFFCHLAIEKMLKGLVIQKTRKVPPYIHDLSKLAYLAGLNITEDQLQQLRIITTFNIAARYDEVKFAFYKKCTPAFTKNYFYITNTLLTCLQKEFHRK